MRLAGIFALALLSVADAAWGITTGPSQPPAAAYPPSCLSAPLTDLPSGPTFSRSTMFASVDLDTSEYRGYEPVDVTLWRVACDGGQSALLVRIARAADANPARAAQFPFTYGLAATQGTSNGTVRLAQEPNTQTSNLAPGALIDSSVTLVVENVPRDGAFSGVRVPAALPPGVGTTAFEFDFNRALNVTIPDTAASGLNPLPPPIVVSIPAYDRSLYSAAASPMPISGYDTGNYFDPAHSGEGMVLEIGDAVGPAVPRQRYVAAAWFTYDTNGRPFWIYGTTTFTPGDSVAVVPMAYLTNGGFAGAFGASAAVVPWGAVTISFPDCASMHFSYAARPDLPTPVPTGSGERTWARLTQPNGLACR